MGAEHNHQSYEDENPITIRGLDIASRSGAILGGMLEYQVSNNLSLFGLAGAIFAGAFCGLVVYSAGADIPAIFREEFGRRNR